MKVAVLGASGLVGSTFIERMVAGNQQNVIPIIHGTGRVGRLARLGIDLRVADVHRADSIRDAIDGATHVVNCVAGSSDVLVKGIKNTIAACRRAGIERLVHLSSVLVYGDRPMPDSEREQGRPSPSPGYATAKLAQDRLLLKAVQQGLPTVIICIPNVSGPYSPYLPPVLQAMRTGALAMVDGGAQAINLVDVRNVAAALELALTCEVADGRRMFVTDGGQPTWGDLVDELSPLLPAHPELGSISRTQALSMTEREGRIATLKRTIARILALSEVKNIIKDEETLARDYRSLAARFRGLPVKVQHRLLLLAGRRVSTRIRSPGRSYSTRLTLHQLRGVRHSIERAQAVLGYAPVYTFEQSMADYRTWYAQMHGTDGPFAELYNELDR